MKANRKMPLATKLTIMYGGIFMILIFVVSIFIMVNAYMFYTNMSQKELSQTADKVSEYIEAGGVISEEILTELNPNRNVNIRVYNLTERKAVISAMDRFFPDRAIWNNEFAINADETPPPQSQEWPGDLLDKVFQRRDPKYRLKLEAGHQYMTHDKAAFFDGNSYIIQVYRSNASEWQILRLFGIIFAVVNLLGVLAAFVTGRKISTTMLKPIISISETAERISFEDLSQRISIEGPDDELKQLAVTFNDMIDRLEISFKKQNQFISDASHELRTPISVIQGYANLMNRWGKNDPDILQESIDSIKAETEHMSTLVKKLLFLAKGEQNKIQIQMAPLSLNLVAEEIIKDLKVLEHKNSIQLIQDSEEYILGDYDLIKQLLWIFLENSIKYTEKPDGNIIIHIYSDSNYPDKCHVSIQDDGIGISEDDLPYIFERFYRADKSRSKEVPGSGLGLSIAGWILKKHEASITVESEYGEGSKFILTFPRS